MRRVGRVLGAVLVAGAACGAAPARAAGCGDRLAAIEARLDRSAETAGAAASGGQAVAAAREGQAQAGGAAPAVPFQAPGPEAAARGAATQAGGDRSMQARATLNRARAALAARDEAGCEAAATEAEGQLGPPR